MNFLNFLIIFEIRLRSENVIEIEKSWKNFTTITLNFFKNDSNLFFKQNCTQRFFELLLILSWTAVQSQTYFSIFCILHNLCTYENTLYGKKKVYYRYVKVYWSSKSSQQTINERTVPYHSVPRKRFFAFSKKSLTLFRSGVW